MLRDAGFKAVIATILSQGNGRRQQRKNPGPPDRIGGRVDEKFHWNQVPVHFWTLSGPNDRIGLDTEFVRAV